MISDPELRVRDPCLQRLSLAVRWKLQAFKQTLWFTKRSCSLQDSILGILSFLTLTNCHLHQLRGYMLTHSLYILCMLHAWPHHTRVLCTPVSGATRIPQEKKPRWAVSELKTGRFRGVAKVCAAMAPICTAAWMGSGRRWVGAVEIIAIVGAYGGLECHDPSRNLSYSYILMSGDASIALHLEIIQTSLLCGKGLKKGRTFFVYLVA